MMKKMRIVLCVGVWSLANVLFAAETLTTCEYRVTGMTCASCSTTVKIGIKKLDGIQSVTVSREKNLAIVTFDALKTKPATIADTINRIGYKAQLQQCKEKTTH